MLCSITRSAFSFSPAPMCRAMSAIVPALTAIIIECARKTTWLPSPTPAIASTPSWPPRLPTMRRFTVTVSVWSRFVRMTGHVKAIISRLLVLLPSPFSFPRPNRCMYVQVCKNSI